MTAIAVLGSLSSHGGAMITAAGQTVLANGVPTCCNGDLHTCPIPHHGVTPVVASNTTVIDTGLNPLQVGDVAGCGAVLVVGSPTVILF